MKNKRILSLVLAFAMLLGTFSFAFADEPVELNEKIAKLQELGLVEGDAGTGDLRLNDKITRAEVAVIVTKAYELQDAAEGLKAIKGQFKDVKTTHWANGYINVLAGKQILNGYPDGTFRPDKEITYSEFVTIMVMMLDEGKAPAGKYPFNMIARAAELGITNDVEVANFEDDAIREKVFEIFFNTITQKDANLIIANTVEGIVVENYRTERLADDEITVHVMKDQVQREGKYYEKDDEFNIKITPELKKKGLDVETLLGQVVTVSFDKEGKVVGIDPIKGYTYVQGEILAIRDKEINVDGKWYTVVKDEGRATTVDERLYQVYFNNEDLHYHDSKDFDKDAKDYNKDKGVVEKPRSFAGKALANEVAEYARVTVRNGKVLFIDAFAFEDVAPVAKDINDKNRVAYHDDAKDGEVLELEVRDSAYVITYEDGNMKLGSNKAIEANDVIHWYKDARGNLTVFVRPFADNKVEGTYKDVSASRAKDDVSVMIKVDDKEYPANIDTKNRNAVYSYTQSEAEFYTLTGDYDIELAPFEKEEVVVLLDMFGDVQSVTAEKVDGSFYALVSDTSRSHGDIKLVRADNSNEWYKTDRSTNFSGNDVPKTGTKDKQFDKFEKYDLVKAGLKEELITDLYRATENGKPIKNISTDVIDFGKDGFFYISKKTTLFVADDLEAMTVSEFIKKYNQNEKIEGYIVKHARDERLADVIVITEATPVAGKTEEIVAKVTRVRIDGDNYRLTVRAPYGKELRKDVTSDTLLVTTEAAQKLLTDKKVVEGSVVKLTVTKDDKQNISKIEELSLKGTFEIVELDRDRARGENYIVLKDAAGEKSDHIWVSRIADTFYDYRKGDVVAIGGIDKYNTIKLLDVRGGKPTGYLPGSTKPVEEKEGLVSAVEEKHFVVDEKTVYFMDEKTVLLDKDGTVLAVGNTDVKAKLKVDDEVKVEAKDGVAITVKRLSTKNERDAKKVQAQLLALPAAKDVTLANKEAIEAAKSAYDALDNEAKTLVSQEAVKKLTDAETALQAIETVINKVKVTAAARKPNTEKEGDKLKYPTDKGGIGVTINFTDIKIKDLTKLEVALYDGTKKLVANELAFDRINDATKEATIISCPFNFGSEGSYEWAWDRGAYPVGEEVVNANLPSRIVVKFVYDGVAYEIEHPVNFTLGDFQN